jgi:hypothetical protein
MITLPSFSSGLPVFTPFPGEHYLDAAQRLFGVSSRISVFGERKSGEIVGFIRDGRWIYRIYSAAKNRIRVPVYHFRKSAPTDAEIKRNAGADVLIVRSRDEAVVIQGLTFAGYATWRPDAETVSALPLYRFPEGV